MKRLRFAAKWMAITLLVTQTVFLVLWITGLVRWRWMWIWAPVWIPAAIASTMLVVVILIAAIRDRLEIRKRRKWQ